MQVPLRILATLQRGSQMRRLLFPTSIILGLVLSAFLASDVYARCRCDRGGTRRQARQERRECRRGMQASAYVPRSSFNPYSPAVQMVGAVAEPSQFRCVNGRCYLIPRPSPDANFQVSPNASKPQTRPEAKVETTGPQTSAKEVDAVIPPGASINPVDSAHAVVVEIEPPPVLP